MKWLIRRKGKKAAAHLWVAEDTLCRMASTGGLKLERYQVADDRGEREACHMCMNVFYHLPETRQQTKCGRTNRDTWNRGVSNVADERKRFERDRVTRSQPTNPSRAQEHKPKTGNGKTIIIPGDGDPCPRCGVPMQIREHNGISDEQLRKPYYSRWFCCMNKSCNTKQVMPPRYKVMNPGSDTAHRDRRECCNHND